MKIVVLNEDSEKCLAHIMDVASKAGGLSVHDHVQIILNNIKAVPENPSLEKPMEEKPLVEELKEAVNEVV